MKIYDGSEFCSGGQCPIVEYDEDTGFVVIYDPDKPCRGKFKMTVVEYNYLLINAKLIRG